MTESNLASALAKAQEKADRVHADRRNEHMRYEYASANAVLSAAKLALAGEGLTLIPVSHARLVSEHTGRADILHRVWSLEHVGGETRSIMGEHPIKPSGRGADEAVQYDIALTNSLKRTLLDLLQIPRLPAEEDVEHGHRKPRSEPERRPAPKKKAPAKKKAKDVPYAEWSEAQKLSYADPDEEISASTPAGFNKFIGITLRKCTNWQRVMVGMADSKKLDLENPDVMRYVSTARLLRNRRKAAQGQKKLQDADTKECLEFLQAELEELLPNIRVSRVIELYELAGENAPSVGNPSASALLEPAMNNFPLLKRLQQLWIEDRILQS